MKDSNTSTIHFTDVLILFADFINKIDEGNLVLGGSVALNLHGLNFRSSSDVDIIIYKPTEKQLIILDALKDFDHVVNYGTNEDRRRAFKFIKRDCVLDIIIEKRSHAEGYTNLLKYSLLGREFRVQSIREVIRAKSSYVLHDGSGLDTKDILYVRAKDFEDFIALKNDNFNPSY